MNQAALAHLGERQTEVHFKSRIACDFWRYCVRSTEAAVPFASLTTPWWYDRFLVMSINHDEEKAAVKKPK